MNCHLTFITYYLLTYNTYYISFDQTLRLLLLWVVLVDCVLGGTTSSSDSSLSALSSDSSSLFIQCIVGFQTFGTTFFLVIWHYWCRSGIAEQAITTWCRAEWNVESGFAGRLPMIGCTLIVSLILLVSMHLRAINTGMKFIPSLE